MKLTISDRLLRCADRALPTSVTYNGTNEWFGRDRSNIPAMTRPVHTGLFGAAEEFTDEQLEHLVASNLIPRELLVPVPGRIKCTAGGPGRCAAGGYPWAAPLRAAAVLPELGTARLVRPLCYDEMGGKRSAIGSGIDVWTRISQCGLIAGSRMRPVASLSRTALPNVTPISFGCWSARSKLYVRANLAVFSREFHG
jgi:hypothetical protein